MPLRSFTSRVVLSLCLVPLLCLVGCKSSSSADAQSSGSAADLSSGAPTFNTQFQTRNPRVCGKMTSKPNAAQAKVMAQCDFESNSRTTGSTPTFFLATDVVVELGKPGPPVALSPNMTDVDMSSNIIPLRGSSTSYTCIESALNPGHNCIKSSGGGMLGQGACWHTTFNEWRCTMTMGGTDSVLNQPGPTAF